MSIEREIQDESACNEADGAVLSRVLSGLPYRITRIVLKNIIGLLNQINTGIQTVYISLSDNDKT